MLNQSVHEQSNQKITYGDSDLEADALFDLTQVQPEATATERKEQKVRRELLEFSPAPHIKKLLGARV